MTNKVVRTTLRVSENVLKDFYKAVTNLHGRTYGHMIAEFERSLKLRVNEIEEEIRRRDAKAPVFGKLGDEEDARSG